MHFATSFGQYARKDTYLGSVSFRYFIVHYFTGYLEAYLQDTNNLANNFD